MAANGPSEWHKVFAKSNIVPRYWFDRWDGHAITEGKARAEAYYAQQMHDAAMRGRLEEFMKETGAPKL